MYDVYINRLKKRKGLHMNFVAVFRNQSEINDLKDAGL